MLIILVTNKNEYEERRNMWAASRKLSLLLKIILFFNKTRMEG